MFHLIQYARTVKAVAFLHQGTHNKGYVTEFRKPPYLLAVSGEGEVCVQIKLYLKNPGGDTPKRSKIEYNFLLPQEGQRSEGSVVDSITFSNLSKSFIHSLEFGGVRGEEEARDVMETSNGNGSGWVSLGSSPTPGVANMDEVGALLSQLRAADDKSFTCDICFEQLWAPIPMCITGHSFCKSCRDKSELCPVCRMGFSEARNFKLERIIAERSFPCPFLSRGCESSVNGGEMHQHMKNCKFAPIQCHFAKADECPGNVFGIHSNDYLEHLTTVHKSPLRDAPTLWVEKYSVMTHVFAIRNDWPFTFASLYERFFVSRVFSRDSNIYFSVAIMGEAEDASLFTAKVLLKSPGDNEKPEDHFGKDHKSCSRNVISFTFPVHSIRLKEKKVFKVGCYAVCPVSYIYDFFSTDREAAEGGRHFWANFQIFRSS